MERGKSSLRKVVLVGKDVSVRITYKGGYKFLTPAEPEWLLSDDEFKVLKKQLEHMAEKGWIRIEIEDTAQSGVSITAGDPSEKGFVGGVVVVKEEEDKPQVSITTGSVLEKPTKSRRSKKKE